MNLSIRSIAAVVLLVGLPLLGACESKTPSAPEKAKEETASVITRATQQAVAEARDKIAKGNITISDHDGTHGKAEITPAGDLLIDGKAVAVTPQQRSLLLEYRGHVTDVAEAGMNIGLQGADLARKAMGEALKGVFTGNTDEVEKRVAAEASKIKASALKLCDRLPAMLASQQQLKASLPEFAPYATMTEEDIADCRKDAIEHEGKHENFAAKAAAAPSVKQ